MKIPKNHESILDRSLENSTHFNYDTKLMFPFRMPKASTTAPETVPRCENVESGSHLYTHWCTVQLYRHLSPLKFDVEDELAGTGGGRE